MQYLVTGVGGFVGYHLARRLLAEGHEVTGVDNLNTYYSVKRKKDRVTDLILASKDFTFRQLDIAREGALGKLAIEQNGFDFIVHLAAQAGVRYSVDNPMSYIQSNLVGFQNVIELARKIRPINFVYASSSSVYGCNKPPFHEKMNIGTPASLYAATKASNELVAHSYAQMYDLESTGLRFHTIYGPNGRPDMLFSIAIEKAIKGEPIDLFWNEGDTMRRNFTYIDDILDGIQAAIYKPQKAKVYNLCGKENTDIEYALELIENNVGKKLKRNYLGKVPGDIQVAASALVMARAELGFDPKVGLERGLAEMCTWHLSR
jgi:UDP-glucuronate 4-epimerase